MFIIDFYPTSTSTHPCAHQQKRNTYRRTLKWTAVASLLMSGLVQLRPRCTTCDGLARVFSLCLDISSLWAMGANARLIPQRRRSVPLVRWSPGAVVAVAASWKNLQRTRICSRTLFIYPSFWGITSQMRDYGNAALIALAFNRPLQHITDARQPTWCLENAWLGCFFEGFETTRCILEGYISFQPNTSTPIQRIQTLNQLNGPHDLVADYLADFSFVLDDPLFFPTKLWDDLLNAKLVQIVDANTNAHLDPAILRQHRPSLYHSLAVSALRTILVPSAFPPRKQIRQAAVEKLASLGLLDLPHRPGAGTKSCVSLHLRWTDKYLDGGIARQMEQNVRFVGPALDRIAQTTHRSNSCLLLVSDDDKHALPMLNRALKGRHINVVVLTRMSTFFECADDYELYARIGHSYVPDFILKHSPDKAFAYFRELVVDIVCASLCSDVLIGLGSSGVSQLIAQYMGHMHRVDANAMALWQEDLLGVTWQP